LARETGVSASYIRSLAVTVRAFPEGIRNPALSTTHHRIAAQTGNPKDWLQRATDKK
jgi:hypothetical protein